MRTESTQIPVNRLRIAVLIDPSIIYAARILLDSFKSPDLDFVKVYVRQRKKGGVGSFLKVARKSGWPYAIDRAFSLVWLKIKNASQKFLNAPPDRLYFVDIEDLCEKFGIPFEYIEDCNRPEIVAWVRNNNIDILYSALYSQILKADLIRAPRIGCVNAHPSLLPMYRGSNPVYWALVEGAKITGLTLHQIELAVDAGPIIAQTETAITERDTHHSLYSRLIAISSELLRDTFLKICESGKIETHPQQHGEFKTYSHPTRESYRRFKANGRRFC